ncbi:hypothetical protein NDU88_004052 [Pleurodeles waltl]|uniref:Uncharacterized protein n=1 Tax=Pleurodeles waltl TaxID=8319 RepID=A0AAV7T6R0_PLEWA|nr:hypothetical protein NDU88_004052 [Pleurodeles waltl]
MHAALYQGYTSPRAQGSVQHNTEVTTPEQAYRPRALSNAASKAVPLKRQLTHNEEAAGNSSDYKQQLSELKYKAVPDEKFVLPPYSLGCRIRNCGSERTADVRRRSSTKQEVDDNDGTRLIMTYNEDTRQINNIISKKWNILKSDPVIGGGFEDVIQVHSVNGFQGGSRFRRQQNHNGSGRDRRNWEPGYLGSRRDEKRQRATRAGALGTEDAKEDAVEKGGRKPVPSGRPEEEEEKNSSNRDAATGKEEPEERDLRHVPGGT